ncbi:MAG: hypothetical protein E7168_02715 [Firmicutes bacterium]|nr:hypothetical protein [Bacillota bacterium]
MKELINDIGKKKLLIILGVIVGLVVVTVVILLLYNNLFATKSYSSIENAVIEAAKKYYNANPSLLPKNPNDEVSINSTSLMSGGYLDDISKMSPDNVSCTATVTVTNVNYNYRYTSKLQCGEIYTTRYLLEYVQKYQGTVASGQGLYSLNGEFVYRGENPNNNVVFGGHKWNIVKFDSNGNAVLIYADKLEKMAWDDRYNAERKQNDGINDYSVSRVHDYLTNLYNGTSLLSDKDKSLVISHDLYIGKRSEAAIYNDGSIEKSNVLENKYIGLLPLYDYINASLDSNCTSALTDSCSNYNYLNANYDNNWWTLTADIESTHRVFLVTLSGSITANRASGNGYLRPVIYLAKDAIYVSGDGTAENPFKIK